MDTHNYQPFPVLDLPLDLGYKVLSKLSVFAMYNLSLVSDEAKSLVKDHVRNENYRLRVKISLPYIHLMDSDSVKQGFCVCFKNKYDKEANSEFNCGEFSVPSNNDVGYDDDIFVTLITRTGWDEEKAVRSLITHMSDVFTKNVCISVEDSMEEERKTIMGLVESLNLQMHCYRDNQEHDLSDFDELLKYPRRCIKGDKISAHQLKRLLEEWRARENTRHLQIGEIPEKVKLDEVMRGYTLESVYPTCENMSTYSFTKTSGVRATVKIIDGQRRLGFNGYGWTCRYKPAQFIISAEGHPTHLVC